MFPERVLACLGRQRALLLLDANDDIVGGGGRSLQEEYVEWRVVTGPLGVQRVQLTTEMSDYWRVLAAYAPERVLDVAAYFASEEEPDISLIYGDLDPFAAGVEPSTREAAFAEMVLRGGRSPYNSGERAIVCMVHPSNSMTALLSLVIAATSAFEVTDANDGRIRCATCLEIGPLLESVAQLGRASDPLLIERLGRLAFEGRLVALDIPGALAISGVESWRLRTPSGARVPSEWFQLSRPMRPETTKDKRYQRVSFEVPPEEGFCISDLIDVTTGESVTTGAQVADLVQVSLHLLASGPSSTFRPQLEVSSGTDDLLECEELRRAAQRLESAPGD